MVRQDKAVTASDLKCSESTYSPAETLTCPTATSNAAAFTCFTFYLSSVLSFKPFLFTTSLENWPNTSYTTSIFLATESHCFTMIIVALVSPQLLTHVNQKMTQRSLFSAPEKRSQCQAGAFRLCFLTCSVLSASSEVPVLGPCSFTARWLCPLLPLPCLLCYAAHTISLVARGKRIFMSWILGGSQQEKNGVK